MTIPYQSPEQYALTRNITRRGFLLIAPNGAALPPRCVSCNASVDTLPIRKTFLWHEPTLFLLLCIMPCIYLPLVYFISKKATISFHLCPAHLQKRRLDRIVSLAIFLIGLALFPIAVIFGALMRNEIFWIAAFSASYAILALAVWHFRRTAPLIAYRIEHQEVLLAHAHHTFLDTFPDVTPQKNFSLWKEKQP